MLVGPHADEVPDREDLSTNAEAVARILASQQEVQPQLKASDVIAYFTGETVRLDGKTGELLTRTPEAMKMWCREYEKGWEPPKA